MDATIDGVAGDRRPSDCLPEVKVETSVRGIQYNVSDRPPILLTLICAIQASVQIVSLCLTSALLVSEAICGSAHVTARLMSTSMFLAGLTTLLQSTVGVRESAFYFDVRDMVGQCQVLSTAAMKISGVLMVVSVVHALIGATGLGGRVTRIIGPVTVTPAVIVMILKLVDKLLKFTLIHLGIATFTLCLMVACSTYLASLRIPVPSWSRKHGWHFRRSNNIRTYAVIGSIGAGWLLSFVLTATGALSDDPSAREYRARTDSDWATVDLASWFYLPYPGQFGAPRFSVALFFGLAVAMLSSVIDSVADYAIVSRLCSVPKPPDHATNRGLLTEGCCSVLSGLFGVGHATSTYVAVTGSLALTGVTSLRVFQVAGVMLMFLGVVGKVGAVLVTIPRPVIGAVMVAVFGSVIGVLIAELSEVDMKRPRNSFTVGISVLLGTLIPRMVTEHQYLVDTGVAEVNHAITAMCGTPLFVAGVIACFLDNTLPGSAGERSHVDEDTKDETSAGSHPVYRLPFIHDYLLRQGWSRYLPFLPSQATQPHDDAL